MLHLLHNNIIYNATYHKILQFQRSHSEVVIAHLMDVRHSKVTKL